MESVIGSSSTEAHAAADLELICSITDISEQHFLPFLTAKDMATLESTCEKLRIHIRRGWRVLCQRDFEVEGEEDRMIAPVFNEEVFSFDRIVECKTWKCVYQRWEEWRSYTHGLAKATHLVQAIQLWDRLKSWLEVHFLDGILDSLLPCLRKREFATWTSDCPSSLVAFYSVHGGQRDIQSEEDFFHGIFGSYYCYGDIFSMRLLVRPQLHFENGKLARVHIGANPGILPFNLFLQPSETNQEGDLVLHVHTHQPVNVARRGILSYFQTYIDRLEEGYYSTRHIIPGHLPSRGISLYPDAGPLVSCALTRGIEVRASARWLPGFDEGLNFGYSIRIRLIPDTEKAGSTCQLVARHWAFIDGHGSIRRVDGEAVVGKQPLFFCEEGKGGYEDLGPSGTLQRYTNATFEYQSQSGPVEGTSVEDTGQASVQGTFSFVPGSITSPTGPVFHVTVARFPLMVQFPFY